MPIYEYICDACDGIQEEIRETKDRDKLRHCVQCAGKTHRILSVPAVSIWDPNRKFPNLSQYGDGTKTFESEFEYKTYKKENHIAELSHDGKLKRSKATQVYECPKNGSRS